MIWEDLVIINGFVLIFILLMIFELIQMARRVKYISKVKVFGIDDKHIKEVSSKFSDEELKIISRFNKELGKFIKQNDEDDKNDKNRF